MISRYTTRNSVYEVDVETRQFRRVSGSNPPTRKFAEDGLWHDGDVVRDFTYWDGGTVLTFSFDSGGYTTSSTIVSEEVVE